MTSKLLKVLLITSIVFVLLITASVFSFAENGAITNLDRKIRVELFDSEGAYTEIQILPGKADLEYALFLPSDCDRSNLRVTFDYEKLVIDGKTLTSGEITSVFAEDKTVKLETENGEFNLKICSSANLPALFIDTESGSLDAIHKDKSYKEKATLTLTYNGKVMIESNALSHIKGRGHSSWSYNQKCNYNIKFAKKTEILGMGAAKKWALVSNNMDPTLTRNAIAYTAAQLTNLPYKVDFRFVDLYINGNYRGNYIICEKIGIGKNRIDINDLEKDNKESNPGIDLDDAKCIKTDYKKMRIKYWELPNEPEDISGGYLLEYENKDTFETASSAFVSKNGYYLNIHSPEHITQNEIQYVSSLYNEFEQAIISSHGKNSKGKSFMDYIDADSFAEAAALFEFFGNCEHARRNFYIYLPDGGDKFFMGPVWDFDASMKYPDEIPNSIKLSAGTMTANDGSEKEGEKNILLQLLSKREFAELSAERSLELCDMFEDQLNEKVNGIIDTIASSAKCDILRWNYEITDKEDVQLNSFISKRVKVIKQYFSDFDGAVKSEKKNMHNKGRISFSATASGKPVIITAFIVGAVLMVIVCVSAVRKKKRGKKSSARPNTKNKK